MSVGTNVIIGKIVVTGEYAAQFNSLGSQNQTVTSTIAGVSGATVSYAGEIATAAEYSKYYR